MNRSWAHGSQSPQAAPAHAKPTPPRSRTPPRRHLSRICRPAAATVRGRAGAGSPAPADNGSGGLFGGLTKTLSSRGLSLGGGGSKDPRTVSGRAPGGAHACACVPAQLRAQPCRACRRLLRAGAPQPQEARRRAGGRWTLGASHDNDTPLPPQVFVAGATGVLGIRIVRELLAAGFKVRPRCVDLVLVVEPAAGALLAWLRREQAVVPAVLARGRRQAPALSGPASRAPPASRSSNSGARLAHSPDARRAPARPPPSAPAGPRRRARRGVGQKQR